MKSRDILKDNESICASELNSSKYCTYSDYSEEDYEKSKEYFKRFPELRNHTVSGLDVKKVGDRVLAANLLWFGIAEEGRMYMLKSAWNKETLKQIDGFTQVRHDDRVTSITNGMHILNPYRIWKKVEFFHV